MYVPVFTLLSLIVGWHGVCVCLCVCVWVGVCVGVWGIEEDAPGEKLSRFFKGGGCF